MGTGRRRMSPEARKAISRRMKRYWAGQRGEVQGHGTGTLVQVPATEAAEDRPRRRSRALPSYVLHLATNHAGEMSLDSRQIGSWGQLVDVLIELEREGVDIEMVTAVKGKG